MRRLRGNVDDSERSGCKRGKEPRVQQHHTQAMPTFKCSHAVSC